MTDNKLNKLTVIGAGVLGGQIAWHSAFRGKNVIVYDLYEEGLERCRTAHQTYSHIYTHDLGATETDIQETQSRLAFSTDLQQSVADADIISECAPEIPDVKPSCIRTWPNTCLIAPFWLLILPLYYPASLLRPLAVPTNSALCILLI